MGFIARERIDVTQIQRVLKRYNLEINVDKTEYTILDRKENSWKNTKKFGTLIGDTEDVQRRKQLSTAALAKLPNVWVRGDKLKKKTKLKLYRALVKSVLTYNCSTWALTQAEETRLSSSNTMNARFHCMFWKTDGVCSGISCDATEKSQPIKPWKDSLSHKGTNTGEDQLLPWQWS